MPGAFTDDECMWLPKLRERKGSISVANSLQRIVLAVMALLVPTIVSEMLSRTPLPRRKIRTTR